jgi:hypothetical protein
VAGSFRRGRETVGDLDILVTSVDPTRAFDVFSSLPEVKEVRLRGGTKETVLLRNGLQVDLRVVEPAAFGAALVYFTGSKDHNVQIRSLAKDKGLRVNEYGVLRGEERIAGATEEDVYAALGLAWVPPELREARGEVEAAAKGPLPPIVAESDVRGDLHVHLPPEADAAAVDRLVEAAHGRGLAYLGVVVEWVDPGGDSHALSSSARHRLRAASAPQLRIFEVHEVAPSGPVSSAAPPADWFVVRPTAQARLPPPEPPSVRVVLVAHRGAADAGDLRTGAAWSDYARKAGAAVEVGPGAERLDSTWARQARETGLRLALPTGVAEPPDSPTGPIALKFARRAGAAKAEVANAASRPPISGGKKGTAE